MQHEYSTDPSRRSQINSRIAVFSFMASIVLNYLVVTHFPESQFTGWFTGPTLMGGIWAISYGVFNHILWKLPAIGLTVSGLRNLNGYWFGTIESNRDKRLADRAAALHIKQTWSTIQIEFLTLEHPERPQRSELRSSSSCMAMFHSSARAGGDSLNYEFVAIRGPAGEALGTVIMEHHAFDSPQLEGQYYAEGGEETQERCRTGKIEYTRDMRERLSYTEIRDTLRARQKHLNRSRVGAHPPGGKKRRASDDKRPPPDDHRPSA